MARAGWEQIDNRMGMINYDLWAWDRTFKTAMQLLFRAPGWNFGYGKAGAQGLADLMRGRMTPAGQFLIGTFLAQAVGAEVFQVLHTGKHIETVTDILFPRNGQADAEGNEMRIRFPGPLKDAYGMTHDPVGTVFNKMSPTINILWRGFAPESFGGNRDFFGDYIRNTADPVTAQGKQLANWLMNEMTPFSFQQYAKMKPAGEGERKPLNATEIEAMAGFTRAPREVLMSPQRRELETLLHQHTRALGPRTQEQKALDERKRTAQEEIRAGGMTPTLDALVEEGAFPNKNALRQFILNAQRSSTERLTRKIPKRFRPPAELPPLGQAVP